MQVEEEEKTIPNSVPRETQSFSIDYTPRQYNPPKTPYSAKTQIIVSIVQIILVFLYVSATHGTPYSETVAELIVLVHGFVTFLLMFRSDLAQENIIGPVLLVIFIVTDTYLNHILSNARWITGNLLDFLFFLICALKSLLYVERKFFPFTIGNTPKKPFIESSETVVSILTLFLVLFYRHYVWQDDTADVVFAATILELLIMLHWSYWADKAKNQVLESIFGYVFIFSDAYILAATWPNFFLFDLIIFISYIPRLLAYLGYDKPFQSFALSVENLLETALKIVKENMEICFSGILMILFTLWAYFDNQFRAFHLKNLDFLVLANVIQGVISFFLNFVPDMGKHKIGKPILLTIITACEIYVMTFFNSFYANASAFVLLYTIMCLLKNMIYIYVKFGGLPIASRCCGGFTMRGGLILSIEGCFATSVILYHHYNDYVYYHYEFLLSCFIISIFVILELLLAPENLIRPPLTYIAGIAYLLSECYTLSVLANLFWITMNPGLARYIVIGTFIYSAIEKTRHYAELMDPMYMWMSWLPYDEGDVPQRTETEPQKYLPVDEED